MWFTESLRFCQNLSKIYPELQFMEGVFLFSVKV